MSNQVKLVAEGFTEDVAKLLRSFAELQTSEFSAFASLWKKHYFSLIFMGRPDDVELTEFTNETFKVASQFLISSTFYFEVGAIFLLYALYRNQISDPPIKIRIELRHWKVIDDVRKEASMKSLRTLHYVIDFLIENAFVFVCHQVLKGPVIATIRAEPKKSDSYSTIKTTYKSDIIDYMSTNNLQSLNELHNQYVDMKQKLDEQIKLNRNAQKDVYKKFNKELETVVQSGSRTRKTTKKDKEQEESIGSRRAKIKALSFTKKSSDFWGRTAEIEEDGMEDDDDDEEEEERTEDKDYKPQEFKKLHGKRARANKGEKRVGRPKKNVKNEEESTEIDNKELWFDINELNDDTEEFYFPPSKEFTATGRRRRATRFHYYKVSPRRDDDEDDEENCDAQINI